MLSIQFYGSDMTTTSREQLQRNASGAGKEVECSRSIAFEIYVGTKYIEQVLFGKIRSGTCLERAWNVEMSASVFACYYAHI